MFEKLSFVKQYLGFTLTLVCIVGSLLLAWFKGIDVSILLPSLLGMYLVPRSIEKSSHVWAACKDADADTAQVIQQVNEK